MSPHLTIGHEVEQLKRLLGSDFRSDEVRARLLRILEAADQLQEAADAQPAPVLRQARPRLALSVVLGGRA